MLSCKWAGGYKGGEKEGEDHNGSLKHHVGDVGPEQVEARHLDGDEEDRVDSLLNGGAHPTNLEEAVLSGQIHGDISIGTVGEEIEECCQVDDNAKDKVHKACSSVEEDFDHPQDCVKENEKRLSRNKVATERGHVLCTVTGLDL